MPKDNLVKTVSAPKPYLWLTICFIAILLAVFGTMKRPVNTCTDEYVSKNYRSDLKVSVGDQILNTEAAVTKSAQQKGLSGRECISKNQAMLFAFEDGDTSDHCFWMKDMKFSIDMVWLDVNHEVVYIENNINPSTYPSKQFCPKRSTKYVIELAAGRAKELKLKNGSFVNF